MPSTLTIGGKTVQDITIGAKQVKSIYDNTNQVLLWEKTTPNYLCFTDASGSSNTLTLTKYNTNGQAPTTNLEYSIDKVNWNTWVETNNVRSYTIPANGKVYLRGDNTAFGYGDNTTDYHNFSSTGNINASGDLMTLLDKSGNLRTVGVAAFRQIFRNWSNLKTPPSISATIAGRLSFNNAFSYSGITSSPEIFVTETTGQSSFYQAFYHCESLVNAGAIHTTDLTNAHTFSETFYYCTALVKAPSFTLNSINGGTNHCMYMFRRCTNLTNVSALKLNATSLGVASYRGMFFDCKNLVTPPEIMATALSDGNGDAANGSLAQMFCNCTKLASIKVHFTSWNSGNYTRNWTHGTKSSGTFYKPSSLPSTKNTSGNTTNPHYIPYNWSVSNI